MNKFVKFLGANRPSILTFVGVGGLIATAVMAYKSYPAVRSKMKELEADKDPVTVYYDNEPEDIPAVLTRKEKAWVYVRSLWPTFTLGAVSTALVVLGNRDHLNRRSAALAAYYISESTLKDYQAEVIKELGEKKEREVRDRVSEKRLKDNMSSGQTMVISDGDRPWVHDIETNCLFRYSYDRLNWIITQINLELEEESIDGISVWDLYDRLGVKPPAGEKWPFVGWNKKYKIDPYFTSTITEIQGQQQPCMVMEYRVRPMYDYDVYG